MHNTSDAQSKSTFFTKATSLNAQEVQVPRDLLLPEDDSDAESEAKSYTTVSRSVDGDVDQSLDCRLPRLDSLRKDSADQFECPFCFRLKKFKKDRAWKRHVYADLRTYVCTFSDCEASYFTDINEWFRHEMQTHRVSFLCQVCPTKTLSTKEEYLSHMQGKHPEIVGDCHDESFLSLGRRPLAQIPSSDCPCCDDWESRLRQRMVMPDDGSGEAIYVLPTVFKRHLASHLEQLALFSVPISAMSDEADSNAAVGNNDITDTSSDLWPTEPCETCRNQKQICDERRPRCTPCSRVNYACIYRKPQPMK
jgi:hypothetical protein